jgi:hypothetical protein
LAATVSYGEQIVLRAADGQRIAGRAGPFLKKAIPRKYLRDKYALYVDADEFLILPAGVESLASLFAQLAAHGVDCVAASLIDFYPRAVGELSNGNAPRSFAELVATHPCFDGERLLEMRPGAHPRRTGRSASTRLFAQCGIAEVPGLLSRLPEWLVSALPFRVLRVASGKTPILRWTRDIWMEGSHEANVPPAPDILLALAHFKFTSDLARRARAAIQTQSHSRGSKKYFRYQRLLEQLRAGKCSFAGPTTRTFEGASSFDGTGLTSWPF